MKLKRIALVMICLLCCATVFVGCGDVSKIEIGQMPATVYELGSDEYPEFSIMYTVGDKTTKIEYTREEQNGIELIGFSTATLGEHTATVKYKKIKTTFKYTVIDSTETIVSIRTATEFAHLQSGASSENPIQYKLENDIDFSGYQINDDFWNGANGCIVESLKNVVIDGNNHKLTGINVTNDKESCFIYESKGNVVIKNLEVITTGQCALISTVSGDTVIENVTRSGNVTTTASMNNDANFVVYNRANLTLTNCVNNVSKTGFSAYGAGFVAFPMAYLSTTNSIIMENCVNKANMQGIKIGAFFANGSSNYTKGNFTITNCKNEGKLTCIGNNTFANLYFATSAVDSADEDLNARPAGLTGVWNVTGTENTGSEEIMSADTIQTTVNDSKQLVISNADETIAKFVMIVRYYGKNASNGTLYFGNSEVIDTKTGDDFVSQRLKICNVIGMDNVDNKPTTNNILWNTATVGDAEYYIHDNTNSNGYKVTATTAPTIYIMGFDVDGKLVCGKQFTVSK